MSFSKGDFDSEPPLKFVEGKDEITGDEYDGLQRVEMSCGHAVDQGSLTAWCRSLMDQGYFKLCCPADVNGEKCGAQWSYPEVRRCAVLSNEEQHQFEQKLALLAARLYCDFKECPRCKSLVERKELSTVRVLCTICTSTLGAGYEFCWQCLQSWKGTGTPPDHCANVGCQDPNLEVLASCATKDLPGSEILACPSIRACPTCGLLIEHKEKCKYVMCSRCHVEFCFACLELAQACQATRAGAWFKCCAKPLAPRQTHIPVWSRTGGGYGGDEVNTGHRVQSHIPPLREVRMREAEQTCMII
ncbi:E3 ubiquitin-protein ligase ARIH2-like [Trichechus inunguis]